MELSVKKAVGYLPRLMGGSSTTLVDSAPFFYGSELWSDVRIVCRDGIVKDAHRLILGAVCPNLRLALDQLDCCCEEKAVLIMQDFPAEEVVQFLQVLYGREADIPEKQQLGLGGLFRAVGCSKLSPTWQAVSGEQLSESSAVKMEEFDQKEEEMRFVEIKAPKRTRKTNVNILESHEEDEVFETIESVEVKLEDVGMESIVTDVEEETDTKENKFSKRTKQSSSGSEAKKSKVLLDLRSLSRDRKVTCPLCDKTGLSEKRFKEHALKVHPEEERPEELINDDESEPDPLDLGESETVQGSSWKCGVMNCDFLFGEEGGDRAAALAASQAHLSSVHGYRGCPSCNLLMPRERLKGHVNRVHDLPFDYSCDICDRPEVGGTGGGGKFKSLLKLTKHRISAHKINGEGVVCENCGSLVLSEGKYHSIHRPACKSLKKEAAVLSRRKHLPENVEVEINAEDPEKCPQCDYRNVSLHKMKSHIRSVHVRVNCPHCEKPYSLYFLQRHIATKHTKQLDYQCELCSERFFRELMLKYHVEEVHIREKKYVCEHCGTGCYSQGQLTRHKTHIHAVNRHFPCSLCNKTYLNKDSLKKHTQIHHPQIYKPGPGRGPRPKGEELSNYGHVY